MRALTGRRAIAVALALFAGTALPATAAGYAGDRDPSFGHRGVAGASEGAFDDVLVQPTGRVIAAGQGPPYLTGTMYGYTPGGQPDRAFGFGGTGPPFGSTQVGNVGSMRSVVELPDGRLLVAALRRDSGGPRIVVARLSADGVPDSTFDGSIELGLAGITDVDLALGPGGEILIGVASSSGFAVARRLADGSPDPGFAAGGAAIAPVGSAVEVSIAAFGGNGVLIGGSVQNGVAYRAKVARFDGAGALDPAFSGDGMTDPEVPLGDSQVNGLVIDGDGRAVLAASTVDGPVAFRLTPGGELDQLFGGDGAVEGAGEAGYEAVALLPDGAMLLAAGDFSVTRLRPDGSLDPSFGRDGRARVSLTGTDFTEVNAIAVQPDGAILVAGGSGFTSFRGNYEAPTVIRLLAGGTIRDADADGFTDDRDRCRFDPGDNHRGCPFVRRGLHLHRAGQGVKGQLGAFGPLKCVRGSKIALLAKRPGRDRIIGRQVLPERGSTRFGFEIDDPSGDYYARTKGRVILGTGLCGPARSHTVTFARR